MQSNPKRTEYAKSYLKIKRNVMSAQQKNNYNNMTFPIVDMAIM